MDILLGFAGEGKSNGSGVVENSDFTSAFSPSESPNILVYENVWNITKFERGHPEQGRFMRLKWVQTGEIGDFFDQ